MNEQGTAYFPGLVYDVTTHYDIKFGMDDCFNLDLSSKRVLAIVNEEECGTTLLLL